MDFKNYQENILGKYNLNGEDSFLEFLCDTKIVDIIQFMNEYLKCADLSRHAFDKDLDALVCDYVVGEIYEINKQAYYVYCYRFFFSLSLSLSSILSFDSA